VLNTELSEPPHLAAQLSEVTAVSVRFSFAIPTKVTPHKADVAYFGTPCYILDISPNYDGENFMPDLHVWHRVHTGAFPECICSYGLLLYPGGSFE
jgi:hypothetical protein